jgi:predicted AAA+ superfamily ATPase
MKRYLDDLIAHDLQRKLVFVTGARQVGKTTLSQQLLQQAQPSQYLNYDVAADRAVIERQSWMPNAKLLVLDELHKKALWKPWLKGVIDGKPAGQQQLVTGSARMDTFRQSGDSLAGRFLSWRLHPISVKEWCALSPQAALGQAPTPDEALAHLLQRGGFPEPCLLPATPLGDRNARRWRLQYADGLVREDILEFSRIQDVGAMRVLLELLRSRVGSPLSLASIGRDLGLSQPTVKRFIDILQALYIVFTVQPWHHNIARSLLQSPKVYFYDTGMVGGQGGVGAGTGADPVLDGLRFENAVACMLLKHAEFLQDSEAAPVGLHYVRTKEGAEIDFALSHGNRLTHLIECKWADATPHKAFAKFIPFWPDAQAVQLVRHLRNAEQRNGVQMVQAAPWLAGLAA